MRPLEEKREAATLVGEDERTWLLYGAYGFTGRLLAREALSRGHRPILSGRDPERLEALAFELDLPFHVASLDDRGQLDRALDGVRAVFHAAGPFSRTAVPMLEACLEAGAHYLDITGEVGVFERIFAADAEARSRGVVLLPGAGMDVIPTDAVAAILKERLPTADSLELALLSPGPLSPGTARTVVARLPSGLRVRRRGRLIEARPRAREFRREIDFGPGRGGGPHAVVPYTWGDLSTAPRTTGIPNVTCYMAMPPAQARAIRWALPLVRTLLAPRAVRRWLEGRVADRATGPDEEMQRTGRVRAWGRATSPDGHAEEAVIETMEAYRFTAVAGIRAMEAVFAHTGPGVEVPLAGAITPAGAFGAGWVLELPETELL